MTNTLAHKLLCVSHFFQYNLFYINLKFILIQSDDEDLKLFITNNAIKFHFENSMIRCKFPLFFYLDWSLPFYCLQLGLAFHQNIIILSQQLKALSHECEMPRKEQGNS